MGTPESDPDVTQGGVRGLFAPSDAPATPITVHEAAEQLDCSHTTARENLAELVDRGELRTKRLDDEMDVWWRPTDQSIAEQDGDQEEFSAFVSAVKDYAIFRLDPDGVVTSWNEGAEGIKGYTAGDIIGKHFSTFYTDEAIDEGVPDRNLAIATEEGRVEDEGWRVRKDGTRFWANVTITAVRDDDGDLQGFTKVTRDMTERHEFEEQLRKEKERFETLVQEVQDYAIFMLDPDGIVQTWNDGAHELKGYSEDVIVGQHFSTFYTEEDRADGRPERNLSKATENGRVEDENWRVRKDGSKFWANVIITALYDDDGELRGFAKVTRDMTERREYEQQLEAQAERLERQRDELEAELDDVFERINDAFYALDEEFRFEYVNDRAAEYLGTSPGELIGRPIHDTLGIDEDHPLLAEFEEALVTQEQRSFERYSNSMGIWEVIRVYPSESGLSVYFRDITERKERERELARTHDLLEHTERIADVGGWEVDPETMEPFWSDHLFELLDVDYDEQPTLEEALDVYHTEEDRATVEGAVEEAMQTGESFDVEVRFPRPVGDVGWLRVKGAPEVEDKAVVTLRGAVQDVTERKRREQRLEELIDRLEESNERLEQFAYAASHDLQEPLRMVSSYLQLIESRYADDLDEDAREFIEFAVDGADRMRDMIDGLLKYSRVETQGEPLEPVELDAVMEDVLANLQVQIEESDAEIAVGDLPKVEGDASQLRQLFQNLLDNAIEYSGDEPPHVEVSAERVGPECRVSIRDEGIGIDPAAQDRIFEVFQRLHSREEYSGTGIGLALCQRIVERHDGDIMVESEPGEGATFTVTLLAPADG